MKRIRTTSLIVSMLFVQASGMVAVAADAPAARAQAAATAEHAPARLRRPIPEVEHVVLISIDGCRPDVLLRVQAPNVRKLMETGSFTFWARTVPVAITLPSHASMLTGVMPEKHGITWNKQLEDADIARPKFPTIFEVAMRYGLTTAVVAGKSKFDAFAQIGHVGRAWTKAAGDDEVAAEAVRTIQDYHPDVLFIHFPGADKEGHANGWASPEQVKALENIDAQIGKVVSAIDSSNMRDKTVILITADHGGAGRGHGTSSAGASPDDARNQHIPWIIKGPGIRKNYDLSQDARLRINTVDTFSTLCYLLGLQPQGAIDGKPVTLMIDNPGQLLQDAK